jgi:hypothetical protein
MHLRFEDRASGASAGLVLAPGTQLVRGFPAGTLSALLLEAVSFDPQGAHSTGALPLEELCVEGVVGLWVDRNPVEHGDLGTPELGAWILDGAGRTPLAPEKVTQPVAPTAHVPGVTPREHQRPLEAPKLHRRPLPPL